MDVYDPETDRDVKKYGKEYMSGAYVYEQFSEPNPQSIKIINTTDVRGRSISV